jgi:DNA-binding transcriptional regulator YhcF (GntR family)
MDDESRSRKESRTTKKDGFDGLVVTAINFAAMSASVAAAISAKGSRKPSVQEAVMELNAKVDRLSEQLQKLSNSNFVQQEQQGSSVTNKKDGASAQKQEDNSQQKPQEVIYVRNASEFWFYN